MSVPAFRAARGGAHPVVRASRLLVALLPLALLAACDIGESTSPAAESGGEGGAFEVVFSSIDPKTVPVGLEDDADPKDVKAKDRQKFKPSKGSETGLDRRFAFTGKRKDALAEGCMVFERTVSGDVTTWVRFTLGDTEQLEDGASLGFLELRAGPAGAQDVYRVEAVWNAGIDGLTARARVNGDVVTKIPIDFHDVHELFLRVADTGFDTVLSVHTVDPAGPEQHDALGEGFSLHDVGAGLPDPVVIAYGAEGLPKKGTVWFAQLVIRAHDAYLGEVEQAIAEELAKIYLNTKQLMIYAELPSVDFFTVLPTAGVMDKWRQNAQALLAEATAPGSVQPLDPGTDAKQLEKQLWKLNIVEVALINQIDKKGMDTTNFAFMKGKLNKLLRIVEPTIAQLYGFLKKSPKQLDKTAQVIH